MNKKESITILLACKKHGIYMSSRNEGDDYLVGFLSRLEVRSFAAAKLITNGLVIEGRLKQGISFNVDAKTVGLPQQEAKRVSKRDLHGTRDYVLGDRKL